MHYYSFNIGDYTSHTAHLTPMEDIAYRRLLDLYYQTESPISKDLKAVCRHVRMRDNETEVALMLSEFFSETDEGWVSYRCEREIADYKQKAVAARLNGRKGGRPKKQTQTQQEPINNPLGFSSFPNENPAKTQYEPGEKLTINHEPITINSVPNGTGGQAAKITDPGEIIFGYGLSMLVNAGTAEKQARSFLGGLRKAHGDDLLIEKLRDCARAKPLQPLEWLAAALPPPSTVGKRIPKTEKFADKNYGSGVEDV